MRTDSGACTASHRNRYGLSFRPLTEFCLDIDESLWFGSGSMTSRLRPSTPTSGSTGHLLGLIRVGEGLTRADLVLSTGLARSTVAQRVEPLLADGLVVDGGEARSTGGRPPTLLRFNPDAGVVLVADLGATHARFGVTNLAAKILAERGLELLISDGPEAVLDVAQKVFDELLIEAGKTVADLKGIGIGVPGPVDFVRGTPVDPPIMPGWGGFAIRKPLEDRYGVEVYVDNDVNIMAVGEYWSSDTASANSIFLKVGTGIGSGLMLDGRLHRGAKGAAGDIGHIEGDRDDVRCRCGNSGCLEAVASGSALAAQLSELGYSTKDSRDVVALVASGNLDALNAVREAGRAIGEVLAGVVNLVNPAELVIGGDLAEAGQPLLAGIREVVYRRSTTLNTSDLTIRRSELGDRAGVIGAAALVIDHILDPVVIDTELIEREKASA